MAYQYIPVDRIIYQAATQLGLKDNIPWTDMIEWIADAEEAIGTGMVFHDQARVLKVENCQAPLPADFIDVVGVFCLFNDDSQIYAAPPKEWNHYRISQYMITNSFIRLGYQDGYVGLWYQARMTDERGFPMVVDTREHREACVTYIAYRMMYIKYFRGDEDATENKLQRLWNQWQYYCTQAKGQDLMPNLMELGRLASQWNRIVPMMGTWFRNEGLLQYGESLNIK